MKRFYFQTTVALLVSLLLLACDDKNKNYPTDYVGFEHSMQSHFYSKSDKEETIEVKVIAVDKKKEDRVCKLNNDRLIIKAGKKEAKATITLFPGKAIKGEIIQIVCTPLWEGGQTSKMSIELIPK